MRLYQSLASILLESGIRLNRPGKNIGFCHYYYFIVFIRLYLICFGFFLHFLKKNVHLLSKSGQSSYKKWGKTNVLNFKVWRTNFEFLCHPAAEVGNDDIKGGKFLIKF